MLEQLKYAIRKTTLGVAGVVSGMLLISGRFTVQAAEANPKTIPSSSHLIKKQADGSNSIEKSITLSSKSPSASSKLDIQPKKTKSQGGRANPSANDHYLVKEKVYIRLDAIPKGTNTLSRSVTDKPQDSRIDTEWMPDSFLRKAVGKQLQIDEDKITPDDMLKLDKLNLYSDQKAVDLKGLERAKNLKLLTIGNVQEKAEFTKVKNLVVISSLKNLEKLSLGQLKDRNGDYIDKEIFKDLQPLAKEKKLKQLDLRALGIEDIHGIEAFTFLENLCLRSNNIADFSPLEAFTKSSTKIDAKEQTIEWNKNNIGADDQGMIHFEADVPIKSYPSSRVVYANITGTNDHFIYPEADGSYRIPVNDSPNRGFVSHRPDKFSNTIFLKCHRKTNELALMGKLFLIYRI